MVPPVRGTEGGGGGGGGNFMASILRGT